jgi:hypothetical protein
MGAAGAAGRQAPPDRDQVADDSLDQEPLAATGDPLQAQDRPLAREREVLRSVAGIADPPTDHPDRVAAADLRDDDPAGEELAQRTLAVGGVASAQQPELLGDPQERAPAQEALEGVAVGVAEAARPDRPVREPAPAQVGERPRLAPEARLVDGRGPAQDLYWLPEPSGLLRR